MDSDWSRAGMVSCRHSDRDATGGNEKYEFMSRRRASSNVQFADASPVDADAIENTVRSVCSMNGTMHDAFQVTKGAVVGESRERMGSCVVH